MKKILKPFFLCLVFLPIFLANGQDKELVFHLSSQDSITAGNDFNRLRNYPDKSEMDKDINKEIEKWHKLSFLTAGIDSTWVIQSITHVKLFIGNPIKLAHIKYENIPSEILNTIGYNSVPFGKKTVGFKEINRLNNKILKFYENNGYPFAQLLLQSAQNKVEGIKLVYSLDKFKEQLFDSIKLKGSAEISTKFLENYLEIKAGEPYNESLFTQIDRKLRALAFVQLTSPTELYFADEKAHIIINANRRKSDKINGLIGFAPNSENKEKGLLLTGEFDLELHNLFKSAKEFSLNWKSFLERSQKLETAIGVPYIFSAPIGVGVQFNLFKSDTFFLNLNTKLSANYLINSDDKLGFFYESNSTNLIYVDTVQIRISKSLPSTNSVKTNYYGLEFSRERLDYKFNPRKGISLSFKGAMGIKKIVTHKDIAKVRYTENGQEKGVYDGLKLRFNQYNLAGKVDYYLPIGRSSTMLFSFLGESLVADNIYVNEQHRLGGFGNLRGFDEESLFATSYGLLNLEYRYLLSRNSFIQLFWNGAYLKNNAIENVVVKEDTPFGFGAGINFETSSGIFNIAYALGRQQNNPIEFRTAKIHFGLTGYF